MNWNHRVLTDGETTWVGEVYYDEDGHANGFTGPGSNLLALAGEDFGPDDLRADLSLIMDAFKSPIITVEPQEYGLHSWHAVLTNLKGNE